MKLLDSDRRREVKEPWLLVFGSVEKEGGGGLTMEVKKNLFYSPFKSSLLNEIPQIVLDYVEPVWELTGRDWEIVSKRMVNFSKSVPGLPDVGYSDVHRLKDGRLEEEDG